MTDNNEHVPIRLHTGGLRIDREGEEIHIRRAFERRPPVMGWVVIATIAAVCGLVVGLAWGLIIRLLGGLL